jgi:hypothetical protein
MVFIGKQIAIFVTILQVVLAVILINLSWEKWNGLNGMALKKKGGLIGMEYKESLLILMEKEAQPPEQNAGKELICRNLQRPVSF